MVRQQAGRFPGVRVVTLDRLFVQPDLYLPRDEVIDGVPVLRIPYWGSSRYPLAPSVWSSLAGADLVHVHGVDFFFDALAVSKPIHRCKLVATTHGGFFHTDAYLQLKKIWLNTATRLSASQYDGIACCSDNDLALFQKIAPNRVRLIENGVDLDKFKGGSALQPAKRLVTIGRFSTNKRLDRLLQVVQHLTRIDSDWHLDIIGAPSDLTVEGLQEMISGLGLKNNVSLHIKVPDSRVREIMSRCSLFVSASEYEGFGIAMIEALSAGLIPVVAANKAFQALAHKHSMVRLADFADPARAAGSIIAAKGGLDETPGLREAAMVSAAQHGWESAIRRYDELYQDVLFTENFKGE
ncbi:glycosyltransferase family 4 protein [uncultured Roseibium sp.]|uniref:glycosyltransferase family 4 protein n=1 Tax=uncultured Roseibium sp. TaxID=1936171 RepID=UPI002633BC16|nr:glycosyltransferase family 4 protein [uncultured Roseibium sp.]